LLVVIYGRWFRDRLPNRRRFIFAATTWLDTFSRRDRDRFRAADTSFAGARRRGGKMLGAVSRIVDALTREVGPKSSRCTRPDPVRFPGLRCPRQVDQWVRPDERARTGAGAVAQPGDRADPPPGIARARKPYAQYQRRARGHHQHHPRGSSPGHARGQDLHQADPPALFRTDDSPADDFSRRELPADRRCAQRLGMATTTQTPLVPPPDKPRLHCRSQRVPSWAAVHRFWVCGQRIARVWSCRLDALSSMCLRRTNLSSAYQVDYMQCNHSKVTWHGERVAECGYP